MPASKKQKVTMDTKCVNTVRAAPPAPLLRAFPWPPATPLHAPIKSVGGRALQLHGRLQERLAVVKPARA